MKDIYRGRLVRLAAESPEALARGFARWDRDSEYHRLADGDPAQLWSEKKHREWIEKKMEQDPVQNYHFSIRTLAEAELGAVLEDKFEQFEPTPLAAASLGQVHRARLRPDSPEAGVFRDVVVKIQRPFIEQLIDVDFRALRRFAGWLNLYEPIRRRADIPALVNELASTVGREIDYIAEGKNAETFSKSFARRRRVHVPRIAWSQTTRRVLTLENVYAIKISDYDAITAAGIDRSQVAGVVFDTYLKQIFEDQFFHADPHPGNLFVTPVPAVGNRSATWKLTFVDFGMVGHVPEHLRDGLRDLLIGIGTRNAGKVVESYKTLGVLLPTADLQMLERAEAQHRPLSRCTWHSTPWGAGYSVSCSTGSVPNASSPPAQRAGRSSSSRRAILTTSGSSTWSTEC